MAIASRFAFGRWSDRKNVLSMWSLMKYALAICSGFLDREWYINRLWCIHRS
jgi:hypothetical protein